MIYVYTGCMAAGKSAALARVHAAGDAAAFRPATDTRNPPGEVVSRNGSRFPCTAVATAGDILSLVGDAQSVIIDEAQFFGPAILDVVKRLDRMGKRVHIACLDLDCHALPFGCVGDLLCMADRVEKLHAVCQVCGAPARYSHRKVAVAGQVFVGGDEAYAPLCGRCYAAAEKEDGGNG